MPGAIFPFASHFLWGPFHSRVGEVSQTGNSAGDEGRRESEGKMGKESQSKREGEAQGYKLSQLLQLLKFLQCQVRFVGDRACLSLNFFFFFFLQ